MMTKIIIEFFKIINIGHDQGKRLSGLLRPDFFSTFGTRNERGSGLGLMLCREFVEQNCGTVRVESQVGTGSTFIFTLPTEKTEKSLASECFA